MINTSERRVMNRLLAESGMCTLDDPRGFLNQAGFLIDDHEHFRQLLTACEPDQRTGMYEALRPNLRFAPWPLEDYLIASKQLAERKQLPIQTANGKLRPYVPPSIETRIAGVTDTSIKPGALELVCKKCTRTTTFTGYNRSDAIQRARESGWTYDEIAGNGREICPNCP